VRNIDFFQYEGHKLNGGVLTVIGTLSRDRKYGGVESLRIRLAYPFSFPEIEPMVFDHERIFVPRTEGHQFRNWALCLQFPENKEFSNDITTITYEVLGASLNWLVKRNIFERTGEWPGATEDHGWARPYCRLAIEHAASARNSFLQFWVEWSIRSRTLPRPDAMCPCLSGRKLRICHGRLGELIRKAIFYAMHEEN